MTKALTAQMTWELIRPDDARKILETMRANRKVIQRHVDKLAELMRRGEWVETAGDPIRFNQQGELIDGQHRLWALLESGVSLHFTIIRGIPAEAMDVLDTGLRRGLKDFLEIHGEKYAKVLSSTLNYLNVYWGTKELAGDPWHIRSLTAKEALKVLEEHPGIRESVTRGDAVAHLLGGGQGRWAAIHYILSRIHYQDTEEFYRKLLTGQDMTMGSPISLLRNRLILDRHSLKRMGLREYSALVFKVWNLYRHGESIQLLTWRGGGAHPEVYPIPE